ncbi:hypothetical protein LQZ44_11895 [Alcaligenes nematophilus]|uniref:hypothetical protein n=1 Tax=Alcaligenes nematophilus TaxID=2994643 RepID=UPI0035B4FF1A
MDVPQNPEYDLWAKEKIKAQVEKVWAIVFQNSNTVLRQHKNYGFLGIERIPTPNIHEIVVQLRGFDALLDILLANAQDIADVEYEQQRQLLNAKSQLVAMGQVAAALKAGNLKDFEEAIARLQKQCCI